MPDIKFSCPHCEQHIAADSDYGGIQINCPSCSGALIVPGGVAAVAAAPQLPPTPPPPVPAPSQLRREVSQPGASGCPSCGAAMGRGAVLCTNCGYNTATGKRTVAGRPAALGKPDRGGQKVPFYATPYPYLGLLGLLLAGTYAWGRSDPLGMLAFACVALLYALVVQILVIIAAFQEGTGRGFLAMCLPFYGIYFVFRVQESDTLKLLYGIAIAINIIVRIVMESAKG